MAIHYTSDKGCNRRSFLRRGLVSTLGAPVAFKLSTADLFAAEEAPPSKAPAPKQRSDAAVAIVACRGYGPEVRTALAKSFDLLGGIGRLVKNKTVTVKINLTGTDFAPFLNRPVGETYMTHFSTALALGSL